MLTIRFGGALLALSLLVCGCSTERIRFGSPKRLTQQDLPSGSLDFAWKLSGDRSVAPLQVFSDTSHTWLQWLPNQTLPAIFGVSAGREQLAPYEREGPYAKLEGHWTTLVFRGAHLQAKARRVTAVAASQEKNIVIPDTPSQPAAPTPTPALTPALTQTASQSFYAVTRTDKNLRQVLARWSGLSGWRFQAEHWAVDVDIPLTATANFSEDYQASVRALVQATELSDRPLQPCFYANQVLRIVPLTEVCDRTVVEGSQV